VRPRHGPGGLRKKSTRVAYKVITTLDVAKAELGREVAQGLLFGPQPATLAADIAYLANLGITPKTDRYDYYRIIGPSSRAP